MQIETYEVEEIKGELGNMSADSEAIELCSKLGLEGQQILANPETATRMPYRCITSEERNIFEVCFPNKTAVERYSDGIIPLRVLQVVAFCKEQGFYHELQVWHPAKGQRDPVLVGLHKHKLPGQTWDTTDIYLLARWGESLVSLDELRKKARQILLATWGGKLFEIKSDIEAGQSGLESIIDQHLLGIKTVSTPNFYWF